MIVHLEHSIVSLSLYATIFTIHFCIIQTVLMELDFWERKRFYFTNLEFVCLPQNLYPFEYFREM